MNTFWRLVALSVVPLAIGRAVALTVQGRWAWATAPGVAALGALFALPSVFSAAVGIDAPRPPFVPHAAEAAVWYLVFALPATVAATFLEGLGAAMFASHRSAVITVAGVNLAQVLGATVLVMAAAWPAESQSWCGALAYAAPVVALGTAVIAGLAAAAGEGLRARTRRPPGEHGDSPTS